MSQQWYPCITRHGLPSITVLLEVPLSICLRIYYDDLTKDTSTTSHEPTDTYEIVND